MRDQYLSPQVTRVASVKDLTLAGAPGSLIDICLSVNGLDIQGQIQALPGGTCDGGGGVGSI